ncbi:hypothetical protein V6N11_083402 [Hibiscus sabdariffa]|uniref:Uncharacterized protein n=1 Tax=Hibiscus sabdariffa TaxID=183260 RepID=A0ABR2QLR4_9ROSI
MQDHPGCFSVFVDCDATFQYYRTQGIDPESRRVEENGCKEPVEAMSPTKARVVSEEVAGGDSRKSSFACLKKITWHVDDEALRRLERCVIGSTPEHARPKMSKTDYTIGVWET